MDVDALLASVCCNIWLHITKANAEAITPANNIYKIDVSSHCDSVPCSNNKVYAHKPIVPIVICHVVYWTALQCCNFNFNNKLAVAQDAAELNANSIMKTDPSSGMFIARNKPIIPTTIPTIFLVVNRSLGIHWCAISVKNKGILYVNTDVKPASI